MSHALIVWLSLDRHQRRMLAALSRRDQWDWAESWWLTEHAPGLRDAGLVETRPGSRVEVLGVRITKAGRRALEAGQEAA